MTPCRRCLLLGALVLAAGCSSGPPMPHYDSKQAEETLLAALDAWKAGQAGALGRRHPPVRFEDEDWRGGLQLADYRLKQPSGPVRAFEDVEVVLVLRDRRGATVEKTVAYQVALAPGLAVLRSD